MNGNFIKNLFVWFIIFASLMGAYQILSEGKRTSNEIQYSEFLKRVNNGDHALSHSYITNLHLLNLERHLSCSVSN